MKDQITELRAVRERVAADLQRMHEVVPEEVDPARRAYDEALIRAAEAWLTWADALLGMGE